MISARDDGLIKAIGLSNITPAHLLHALRATDVACVQNEFHLADRSIGVGVIMTTFTTPGTFMAAASSNGCSR